MQAVERRSRKTPRAFLGSGHSPQILEGMGLGQLGMGSAAQGSCWLPHPCPLGGDVGTEERRQCQARLVPPFPRAHVRRKAWEAHSGG